jgi:serine/threonine-protein kinase
MTRLPEVVARFEREAMAAAHIDHPNVVTATDFGKLEDGSFFLALEFVEGKSLREVIAKGRLELGRALHIARQIAGALQRAHALKIVHRDLKPENVMLVDRDGDPDFVKVLDFGIAKVQMGELGTNERGGPEQSVLTQAGMVYGTPEYMAPEQALGQSVDARADLYALGIMTFEMLTGYRPFVADSKVALLGMQVTAPVPAMALKCPDCNVPAEVEALVKRLLVKEASERTNDAREFIDTVGAMLSSLAAAGTIDTRFAPPPLSGFATNPGILSGIAQTPPFALLPAAQPASSTPAPQVANAPSGGRTWLLAMAVGVLGLCALVFAVMTGKKPAEVTLTPPQPDAAGLVTSPSTSHGEPTLDDRINEAIGMTERGDYGSGIKKLEELGSAVEGREDVHRALLNAYAATDRPHEAMREAGLVLKANPNLTLRDEVKLRVEIRDTALKEGAKDAAVKSAVDEAFTLLDSAMGTIGWDDLYDIAYGQSGAQYPKAAARARSLLAKGDRSKMSPALQVALDLSAAGASCTAKSHFDRAQKDGDERTLALLRQLAQTHNIKQIGVRKIDMLGCLHDGQLARTVATLEDRLRSSKRK